MKLYRIVQNKSRASDLSGIGASIVGGRWNSKGTFMLYTSANSSLAYLECLVHFDDILPPPQLYITELEIADDKLIFTLPDDQYNANWKMLSLLENQQQGDQWMNDNKWLGIKVRSAINELEYNCLLNPHYPDFYSLVKINSIQEIEVDDRLVS